MPPGRKLRWKAALVLQPNSSAASVAVAVPAFASMLTTTTHRRQRRGTWQSRETCRVPLQDHVTLTPGGHRKHVLQRTSPGGTKRSALYISPCKGDIGACGEVLQSDQDIEYEQYSRRCDAMNVLNEVPGQQSNAQRSAAKRARAREAQGTRLNRAAPSRVQIQLPSQNLSGPVQCSAAGQASNPLPGSLVGNVDYNEDEWEDLQVYA